MLAGPSTPSSRDEAPRGARLVESPSRPIDVARSLRPVARGASDATAFADGAAGWVAKAYRTPLGPATARFSQRGDGALVEAWGPGADWVLERAPALVGEPDPLDGFAPSGLVREIHRRHLGLRVLAQGTVAATLVPVVLEQKVTVTEAHRAYAGFVKRHGEFAPGPFGLRVPIAPEVLASTPYFAWHPFGVERRRADTLQRVGAYAARLDAAGAKSRDAARAAILSVRGLGPWSAAEVGRVALGDADAVSVGDFHVPNLVAWNLAGEARADDARMLELLAPYEGHRGRVQMLLQLGGRHAPRFGPRFSPRDFRKS